METVYYTSFKVLTGNFWIASTDEGIFQASIHSTEEQFMTELKRRVKGTYVHAPEKFTKLQAQLAAYFKGKLQTFNYKLDLRGTEFQKAIWREIHKVPFGRLISYGGLARAVGKPKAVRAAGNATGANPIGLIIPCHRVIGSDGGLGGFGGGLPLKRKLLENEGILGKDRDESKKALKEFLI